jgi:hypothetical protein
MGFVYFTDWEVFPFQNNIKYFVFVMYMKFVFWELRIEFSNVI